jgi:hypothetical protein
MSPVNISKRLTAKSACALLVVAAFLCLLAVSALSRGGPPPPTAAGVRQEGPRPGPRRLVRFTLYDAGVYPEEVHVDRGIVAFLTEDLTGASAGLVVEREEGHERVGDVRRAGRGLRGRQEVELTPGRYRVYDAGRPEKSALLVVEP